MWPEIIILLITAVTGGGAFKVFDVWLQRNRQRQEAAEQNAEHQLKIREEMRGQITMLETKFRQAEKELDTFKEKYWEVYTEYQRFKLEVYAMLVRNGIKPEEVLPSKES